MLKGAQRKYKTRYRVTNWRDYNEFLSKRAALSIWISPEAIENWRGHGRFRYSDDAIDAILMLRAVFQLPLRQANGLVRSIFRLIGLDLPIPDISTLSRRGNIASSFTAASTGRPRNLAIDSTGIRLHGSSHPAKVQGARKHRNGWRKLHVIVDVDTGEIITAKLTSPNVNDGEAAPDLVARLTDPVHCLYGDGAYRSQWFGSWLRQFYPGGADPMMPVGVFPPSRPELENANRVGCRSAMDEDIHLVREKGWRAWRQIRGYGKREAVERAFSRLKRTLGFRLRSRTEAGLQAEAIRMVRALNVMNELGRPVVQRIV